MLKTGTKILCPQCGIELFEVIKDIHDGDILKAEKLKPINQTPANGDIMSCKACGALYINAENGSAFTDNGWKS